MKHYNNETMRLDGFTLLEVLLAIGIFVLVIGSLSAILFNTFKTRNVVFEQLNVQNEARKVVQDFVNEIRSATASSIGAYPLEAATTSSITFYTNLDADNYRERVRYFLQGTILKKGIIKPGGNPLSYDSGNEIITNIAHSIVVTSTPLFIYFDQNYNGTTTSTPLSQPVNISQVRMVGIQLTLEKDPNGSPTPFTAQAKGAIRNLKSN